MTAGMLDSILEVFVSEELFEVDDNDDTDSKDRKLKEVSRSCEPLRTYSWP